MKRLFARKWIVVAVAIAIALSLGAVAWAATSTEKAGTADPDARHKSPECPLMPPGHMFGKGGHGKWFESDKMPDLEDLKERFRERAQEAKDFRRGVLDLIREKMSTEDKAKLDDLLQQAERQRDELAKQAKALRETCQEIRDLIKKYLPAGKGRPSSGEQQPGGSTTS